MKRVQLTSIHELVGDFVNEVSNCSVCLWKGVCKVPRWYFVWLEPNTQFFLACFNRRTGVNYIGEDVVRFTSSLKWIISFINFQSFQAPCDELRSFHLVALGFSGGTNSVALPGCKVDGSVRHGHQLANEFRVAGELVLEKIQPRLKHVSSVNSLSHAAGSQ